MYLERLAEVIRDTSLCGLGQTAPNPVLSTLRWFRDEYEAHVYERRCPAGACTELLTYRIDPRSAAAARCVRRSARPARSSEHPRARITSSRTSASAAARASRCASSSAVIKE